MQRTSRLPAILNERHLSREALARGANVSVSTAFLAGRGTVPGPMAREKIAAFLGLDQDSIWPLAMDAIERRASHG